MMRNILFVILASALLLAGCDTTTTDELLNGDFLPADTSPPTNQSPENGVVVIDHNDDIENTELNDVLDAKLSWTAKSGAKKYIVEVFRDRAMTIPISGSPFTIDNSDTSKKVILPSAGNYWWHVRVSEPEVGEYSDLTVFDAREDCLYVWFDYDPDNPNARPDDTGKTGNIDSPFQSINRAIAEAYRLDISTVKVATRGEITPGSGIFAAYEEYFIFEPKVNLKGGYLYLNPEGGLPSMTRAEDFPENLENNPYETRLEGRYSNSISFEKIFAPTVFEGFTIRTDKMYGLKISYCGNELTIRDCIISSNPSSGSAYGLHMEYSDSLIIHNYFSTGDGGGNTCGIEVLQGSPTIIDNTINSGSGLISYGINNMGNPLVMNNIIAPGPAMSQSYGIYNQSCDISIQCNNVIVAGNVPIGDIPSTTDKYSCGMYNENCSAGLVIINNTLIGGDADVWASTSYNAYSFGMRNFESTPLVINNIFYANDPDISRIDNIINGVYGFEVESDDNYYYNCIYSSEGSHYTNITADSTNITVDPLFVSTADFHLSTSSQNSVMFGGYDVYNDSADMFSDIPTDVNYLPQYEEYLTDIAGVARTTNWPMGSDPGNGGSGWSMGAYEQD